MATYVHGVSTPKVDDLVAALGVGSGISKSEVSRICASLDAQIAAYDTRPLDGTAFPCRNTPPVPATVDARYRPNAEVLPRRPLRPVPAAAGSSP
nr:ORF4 [Pseudomonas sp. BYT-1]QUQ62275.1 ORF4 [Hydrogenophaga sp. BYT-2]QUQ62282.1 ORF4 [Achromobacter sp. BYT-3]QUQ62289.1 ORF4 [Pseudomonas sp. BYT-4]